MTLIINFNGLFCSLGTTRSLAVAILSHASPSLHLPFLLENIKLNSLPIFITSFDDDLLYVSISTSLFLQGLVDCLGWQGGV